MMEETKSASTRTDSLARGSFHKAGHFVRLTTVIAIITITGLTISTHWQVKELLRTIRSLPGLSTFTDSEHLIGQDTPKLPRFQFPGPYNDRKNNYTNRAARWDGCMRFLCAKAEAPHCHDHRAETNYHHPTDPPCCTHILRDMIRLTDAALSSMNLEYFAMYGTLLGLVRNGHVIPWTADNDFAMSFEVHEEMVRNRDYIQEHFGLHLTKDDYMRTCAADNFMGGALARWRTTKLDKVINKRGK